MKKISCSVAMATYNGSKYILEQLRSIVNQTRLPDEIVICDDCSTDDTFNIVKQFISKITTIDIKLIRNDHNLGYTRNFLKAAELSSGDVIFFSDQDDIWNENKIERMMDVFEHGQDVGAVLCRSSKFKCESELIRYKTRKKYNEKAWVSYELEDICKSFTCGGLNLALRKKYILQYAQLLLNNSVSHDVSLGIIISSMKRLYYLNDILVYHRIHNNNVSKVSKSKLSRFLDFERQRKSTYEKFKWLSCCKPIVYSYISQREKLMYESEIDFYYNSYMALCEKKIKKSISLFRYFNNPFISKKILLYTIIATFMIKIPKTK